jgi:hypothetical protein
MPSKLLKKEAAAAIAVAARRTGAGEVALMTGWTEQPFSRYLRETKDLFRFRLTEGNRGDELSVLGHALER